VLRGDGPKQGVPFIDDHIHTSETIVDYLTEFSGIKCKQIYLFVVDAVFEAGILDGDLDPVASRYTLTPLKLVYKKLRLLVDSGCIFIGHGLTKDFRIISQSSAICLPAPSPIMDSKIFSCHQNK
jgi:PAB-dependent poly(A)-specific ribonuclease subunit 2